MRHSLIIDYILLDLTQAVAAALLWLSLEQDIAMLSILRRSAPAVQVNVAGPLSGFAKCS